MADVSDDVKEVVGVGEMYLESSDLEQVDATDSRRETRRSFPQAALEFEGEDTWLVRIGVGEEAQREILFAVTGCRRSLGGPTDRPGPRTAFP